MADEDAVADLSMVRPYVITGRRPVVDELLPIETIVATAPSSQAQGLRFERRKIVEACRTRPTSIAELASDLDLPLGVAGLLVAELANAGHLVANRHDDHDIDLIERLIAGIRNL